jgi:aminoglycoside phosphotransferase (APT) family kinase protein
MTDRAYAAIANRLYPGAAVEAISRLAGGVSAEVRRLDLRLSDGSATRVVVRVHGATHSSRGAELEYRLLKALHRGGLPVPKPLLVDVSGTLLTEPYLVMAFIDGSSALPAGQEDHHIDVMAQWLARIHGFPLTDLPPLPTRNDPLPEVFDFLPEGAEWQPLATHLRALSDTGYRGPPALLHGDFWPHNLLWRNGTVTAILDWEDAALGDPLSDVACSRLELRYKLGTAGMARFTEAYARHRSVDRQRLALWQVYVAAAAQRFMGNWGLDPALEAHMRAQALASIREAGAQLMGGAAERQRDLAVPEPGIRLEPQERP